MLAALLLGLSAGNLAAQRAKWVLYRASDGLAESACTSVTISPRGNVWIKHSEADLVSVLNGYEIRTIPAPTTAGFRIAESRAGQIWAVVPEGLMEYRDREGWSAPYSIPEVRREYQDSIMRPKWSVPILPVEQDRVLLLLTNRLIEFNAAPGQRSATTVLRNAAETKLGRFIDLLPARDGSVWITGANGLARIPGAARGIKADTVWNEYPVEPDSGLHEIQHPLEDEEGGLTAVAEHGDDATRVLVHFVGGHWQVQLLPGENLRAAWKGLDDTYWAATISAYFQIIDGQTNSAEREPIIRGQIRDVAVETNGVFWLATSEGLYRSSPALWRAPVRLRHDKVPVHAIHEDSDGRLWFAQGDALLMQDGLDWRRYPLPPRGEKDFPPSLSLYGLADGTLATDAGDGLFQFDPATRQFRPVHHPDGGRIRALGVKTEGVICVQVFGRGGPGGPFHLELFDGRSFQPFPEAPPAVNLGAELNFFFVTSRGEYWLGGNRGVARFHEKRWESPTAEGEATNAFRCVAEIGDGRLWFGTAESIIEFDGRKWNLIRSGGSGFRALTKSRDGIVWAGFDGGLLRLQKGTWIANGTEEGLEDATVYAVHEDYRGRIWAATSGGINRFFPEIDTDPPRTTVKRLGPDRDAGSDAPVLLTFTARDRWDHTPVGRLLYAFRLDDQDWSPYSPDTAATYNELIPGKHVFHARAIDRNGNIDLRSARYEFAVTLPWYRETRLLLVSVAGAALIAFFAALAMIQHLRLIRSYAEIEKTVALRTRELERANHELLHSQKMNALGTLAAGIAHDFNNILSIIKGSAQIIEANPGHAEKIKTRVDRIKTVVDQGAGIVRAMLGFSRTSDQQTALYDLNVVVEDTVRLLGDRFQRDVEISFDCAPDLPPAPFIKDFLQQMLLNFIFNASDAMEGHGHIFIRTSRTAQPPPHMVLSADPGESYLIVSVRDTGGGIPPEVLPRIFEPFFTTKAFSSRRGTGLGLSMVYELARQIGCGLTVDSTVGVGSTFTLVVPVRPLPAVINPAPESHIGPALAEKSVRGQT